MEPPVVKICCFCIKPRIGALILAWLHIIFGLSFFTFINYVISELDDRFYSNNKNINNKVPSPPPSSLTALEYQPNLPLLHNCIPEFRIVLLLTACLCVIVGISSSFFVHGITRNKAEFVKQWLVVVLAVLLVGIGMQMFLLKICWKNCQRVMAATIIAFVDSIVVGKDFFVFAYIFFQTV